MGERCFTAGRTLAKNAARTDVFHALDSNMYTLLYCIFLGLFIKNNKIVFHTKFM
jgi:hypothetical protein